MRRGFGTRVVASGVLVGVACCCLVDRFQLWLHFLREPCGIFDVSIWLTSRFVVVAGLGIGIVCGTRLARWLWCRCRQYLGVLWLFLGTVSVGLPVHACHLVVSVFSLLLRFVLFLCLVSLSRSLDICLVASVESVCGRALALVTFCSCEHTVRVRTMYSLRCWSVKVG